MTSTFIAPQNRAAWQRLEQLASRPIAHLRDLLKEPTRGAGMSVSACGITLDFSRQRINDAIDHALLQLAEESEVQAQAQSMFRGDAINATENRAVLHVALRGARQSNPPWGAAISQQVNAVLDRMLAFADRLYDGQALGYTGQAITDVVNIGIGGSDLGPRMAAHALQHLHSESVRVHFISNPDAWGLHATLRPLKPETTLFIIASKTFTTQETMTLAHSARQWLLDGGVPEAQLHLHLAAVSAAPDKAAALGVDVANVFGFWDWVGGRYSVWSAVGLALAVAIGGNAFRQFLAGAHEMDQHFLNAPAAQNLPLRMALLGIWNRNFLNAPSHLIVPYASRLLHFTPFIQQMDMESQGKRTLIDGSRPQVGTGPIIWGGLGIDGQHAYFQLVHQGMHLIPADFIGVREEDTPLPLAREHQRVVHINLRAQVQALAQGRDEADTAQMLQAEGLSAEEAKRLAPHRSFEGNVPTNVLWLDHLNASTLGALIALYEHKVFCQSAIWGIHAYDQWGVELGKTMVKALET
jgi:glucose-6-phosphate isomerase